MRQTIVQLLAGSAMILTATSCQTTLGECDEAAAFGPLYYDADGNPAYPGQALMEVSCANGSFCHSSGIEGESRLGAPEGLELDVYASDGSAEDVERLRYARRVAWNLRHAIWTEVAGGHMPPSAPTGPTDTLSQSELDLLEAVSTTGSFRADGVPLPDIRDAAGRDMLRNWLACGAHVVEATSGTSQGVGDIVPAGTVTTCPGADLQTDPSNCGACGITCGAEQRCDAGSCRCVNEGLVACAERCVDLMTDRGACGACDTDCGAAFCASGTCVAECPGGTADCGGSCVELATSLAHCGGCGNACGGGEVCEGGLCVCGVGTLDCGGSCVDTERDAANCGSCGNACQLGASCEAGACACSLTECGGACVDVRSSPQHCGACGNACADGVCSEGECVSCGSEVSFAAQIAPVLDRSCTSRGCHSGPRPAASLDLTPTRAHAELVGVPASCGGRPLVAPSDVAGSYLWNKLTGQGICSGNQMPKAGEQLPSNELALIEAWICRGAAND